MATIGRRHALAAAMLIVAVAGDADASGATRRDAEDYAIATCLTAQSSPYLRDQGFGLGAIVVERAGGAVDRWAGLVKAVKAELAGRPMLTIHGDGPVGVEKAMPVAQCLQLLRAPRVMRAIDTALRVKRRRG